MFNHPLVFNFPHDQHLPVFAAAKDLVRARGVMLKNRTIVLSNWFQAVVTENSNLKSEGG